MESSIIGVIIYLVIGLVLAFYWFNKDYEKEYDELVKSDIPDRGVTNLFLLCMWVFWPIYLMKNLIKYKRI